MKKAFGFTTFRNLLSGMAMIAALVFSSSNSLAVNPDERLENPALEQRARDLSVKLRCLVCQNQSIDDSEAPLARDLRLLLRKRLVAGDSDDQAIEYIVSRYGEFILLKPRFGGHTLLLWLSPVILILLGGMAAFFNFRNRKAADVGKLTENERVRIEKLLNANS